MASVYYLIDDALHVADDLVDHYTRENKDSEKLHRAATLIQTTYKKYVARKMQKVQAKAATTLQKYTRGWLVRYHFPDHLGQFYDQVCKDTYHRAATVVQAHWRGFQVRKEVNVKAILEEQRQKWQKLHAGSLETAEEDPKSGATSLREPEAEKALKRFILEMMFDRHHLISTKTRRGVFTVNRHLQIMEDILKNLPWKPYMTKLRQLYSKYQKNDKQQSYIFNDQKMRKWEDLTRLRDTSQDLKDFATFMEDSRKPFKLTSKLAHPRYQKQLTLEGNYTKRVTNITRTEDKTLNVDEKEIIKESGISTGCYDLYQDCWEHFLP